MRIGLVGYGTGGRTFHAPFIRAAGLEIAGVVTRSATRRAELAEDLPGVPAYDTLSDLLAAGVDAVTITTPPQTRRELVLEALRAGVPVVADKPFAPDALGAEQLRQAAEEAAVPLAAFHNRRWDADVRTIAGVLESGELGELWRLHSTFDLDEPGSLEVGPAHGLLRDVGTHMVDQAMHLLGPVRRVSAHLDWTQVEGEAVDCGYVVTLSHTSGAVSHLSCSKLNHLAEHHWRLYGSHGSYTVTSQDVQAVAIREGRLPTDDPERWGYDAPENAGTLRTADVVRDVPSAQGDYAEFYRRFAVAVAGQGELPVTAAEAVEVIRVLDAARISDAEGRTVELPGSDYSGAPTGTPR